MIKEDGKIKNNTESSIKEDISPDYVGHRQRLKARYSADEGRSMPDYELLELLLTYAIPRRDVKPLAKSLMRHYINFSNILAAPIGDTMEIPGVGSNAAVLLSLVHTCAKKITWENLENKDSPILTDRRRIVEYCRSCIGYAKEEQLLIIYLDIHGRYIKDNIEQVGTIDSVFLNPRDIIGKAINNKACGLILAHNHPSGDCTPSRSDIDLTRELKTVLKSVRIKLEDHIVISTHGYYSMKEHFPFMHQL